MNENIVSGEKLSNNASLDMSDYTRMSDEFEKANYIKALERTNFAFIKQKIELLEVVTNFETKNRYNVFIRNPDGTTTFLYKAKEESGCCARNCCK